MLAQRGIADFIRKLGGKLECLRQPEPTAPVGKIEVNPLPFAGTGQRSAQLVLGQAPSAACNEPESTDQSRNRAGAQV